MRYVGIDVGGTKCAVTLGEQTGDNMVITGKKKFATAGKKPYEILDMFLDQAKELMNEQGLDWKDFAGIGVSCGGPLDAKRGVVMCPPSLPDWDEIPVVRFFEEHTGLPCRLQNDANACAIAEWKYGAGKGTEHMVFITFGTGFGAGLILNGKLYSGASDMAGEIGHVRAADDGPFWYGKYGCVESFCSGGSIGRLGRKMAAEQLQKEGRSPLIEAAGSLEAIDAKIIGDLAEQGDPLSLEVYASVSRKFGLALGMLMDIVNPEMIVVGGVFARRPNLLLPIAKQVYEEEALPYSHQVCRIVPCGLGEQVGDFAALSLATGDF